MKPISDQQNFLVRGRRFLRWTGRFFYILGGLTVAYVALTLLYAKLYQHTAAGLLESQIHAEEGTPAPKSRPPAKEGDILGRLEIPGIKLSVIVLEGTTTKTLRLGAGHIVGTALPGEHGNIAIAAHRDTWFRALKDIHRYDIISLKTPAGTSTYQVDWIQITTPGDVTILTTADGSSLTLVTCYPFQYIGAAPERFIVHARKQ